MSNTHSIDYESSSSQYSYVNDTVSTSQTGDISMDFWLKPESYPSSGNFVTICGKWDPGANKRSYVAFINNDGGTVKLDVQYSSDGTTSNYVTYKSNAAMSNAGVWEHYGFTIDVSAKEVILYKAGSVFAGTKYTDAGTATSIHDNNSRFTVGGRESSGSPGLYYDGLINNVRLWSDIRTQTEMNGNKNIYVPVGQNNLVDIWYRNNNHNSSSGNNNLTAVNNPIFSTDIPFQDQGALFFSQL
jgi:hypothetical protein